MARGQFEALAKAAVGVAVDEVLELLGGEAALRGQPGRGVHARVRLRLVFLRVPEDAARARQLLFGEEARLPVSHRDQQTVPDTAVVVEEEETYVPGLGVAIHVDVVGQGLPRLGELSIEREVTSQQPVDPIPLVQEVRSQPRDEQQIRLTGLDHHPRRHATAVEVPGAQGLHVCLGDHPTLLHGAGLALHQERAVCEEQRHLGHPDLARVAVLLLEELSEYLAGEVRQQRSQDTPLGENSPYSGQSEDTSFKGEGGESFQG